MRTVSKQPSVAEPVGRSTTPACATRRHPHTVMLRQWVVRRLRLCPRFSLLCTHNLPSRSHPTHLWPLATPHAPPALLALLQGSKSFFRRRIRLCLVRMDRQWTHAYCWIVAVSAPTCQNVWLVNSICNLLFRSVSPCPHLVTLVPSRWTPTSYTFTCCWRTAHALPWAPTSCRTSPVRSIADQRHLKTKHFCELCHRNSSLITFRWAVMLPLSTCCLAATTSGILCPLTVLRSHQAYSWCLPSWVIFSLGSAVLSRPSPPRKLARSLPKRKCFSPFRPQATLLVLVRTHVSCRHSTLLTSGRWRRSEQATIRPPPSSSTPSFTKWRLLSTPGPWHASMKNWMVALPLCRPTSMQCVTFVSTFETSRVESSYHRWCTALSPIDWPCWRPPPSVARQHVHSRLLLDILGDRLLAASSPAIYQPAPSPTLDHWPDTESGRSCHRQDWGSTARYVATWACHRRCPQPWQPCPLSSSTDAKQAHSHAPGEPALSSWVTRHQRRGQALLTYTWPFSSRNKTIHSLCCRRSPASPGVTHWTHLTGLVFLSSYSVFRVFSVPLSVTFFFARGVSCSAWWNALNFEPSYSLSYV